VLLAVLDDEGMIFVEQGRIGGEVLHEEGAELFVTGALPDQTEADKEPPRVGIHHERRFTAGIEEDRVAGLRADARDHKELIAQLTPVPGEEPFQAPAVAGKEPVNEGLESLGLDIEEAGRPDDLSEPLDRDVAKGPRR
jgi:hypothetical protein